MRECLIKIFKSLLLLAFQSFPLKLVSSASACHLKQRLWLKLPPPFPLSMGPLIPSPKPPPLKDYGYQIPPPPPLEMAKVSSPIA